jgi:hypothetical protein
MTDHQVTDAAQPTTAAFCHSCGARITAQSTFCGSCGQPLGAAPDAGEPAQTQTGAGPALPPVAGLPPGYPPAPYGYPPAPYPGQPQPQRTNTGLIVGLVAVGFAAVGAIAAVILLATGSSSGSGATIRTATSAAAAVTPGVVRPIAPTGGTGSAGSLVPAAPKHKRRPAVAARSTATASATATTAPVAPSPTVGPADIEAARQVVMHHWSFINSGDFSAAFALFVPGTQGSESSWVSSHQQEAPISASVSAGTPTFSDSTDANVPLLSLQTSDPTDGCSTWTGSYDVQKVSGQWLISKTDLQKQQC